jgi:WD40 repeat protein
MKRQLLSSYTFVILGVLLIGLAGFLQAGGSPKKAPIPSKEAQAKARALIIEIFKDDLAMAQEPAAKSKLAAYFLQQGKESKDEPANRYVLYRDARDLAAHAGDATLALAAVDELGRDFDIPAFELKVDTLALVAQHTSTKEAAKGLVDLILPLVTDAVESDNYESALKLGQIALDAAKKSKSLPLVSAVQKRNLEVQAVQKGFAHLQPYVERLKKDPTDAEANFHLGMYYALLKGKWDRALPLLAMGSNDALKALAKKDLVGPKEARDQLELADDWWELAGKEKDPARLNLQRRAMVWYEKAVLNLAGLNRTKALRRIETIAARLSGAGTVSPAGPVGELKKLEGHTEEIKGVAFSPDGRLAVSGGLDQTVKVWNLTTGKEVQTLRGHSKQIWGVAFHPNNRQVLSASWDATARLWDIKQGNEVKRFTHPIDVNGVAVSRDGSHILVGCDNQNGFLWNVANGEEERRFGGFTAYVYAVAFAPDGRHVACGSADKNIRIYEITGQQTRLIEGQTNGVTALAFSPDSRFLYSCGDGVAHQWEVSTGKELRRFEGHTGLVQGLALSGDGRRLVTGGDDKTVRLWDTTTGKQLHVFKGHDGPVNAVAITANGRLALSAGLDRTVRLWGLP